MDYAKYGFVITLTMTDFISFLISSALPIGLIS